MTFPPKVPSDAASTTQQASDRPIVITGGAGFVGVHLAEQLLTMGQSVTVFDNLSQPSARENIARLQKYTANGFTFVEGDIRNPEAVHLALKDAGGVFHLAAQVSVNTSVHNPRADFEVNALGTLNVLEALRALDQSPFLIFGSTHKVYGPLTDIAITETSGRYAPVDPSTRARGISETRRLDFISPYGCSKGSADQYVVDYARHYELPAAVVRMGSVYGARQIDHPNHGWVTHFLLKALRGEELTIFGDGKQVRDLLDVDDLVRGLILVSGEVSRASGRVFNIGGGVNNAASVLDVVNLIEEVSGKRPKLKFAPWRTGDQRYYVSDTRALRTATGWEPKTSMQAGMAKLYRWTLEERLTSTAMHQAANDDPSKEAFVSLSPAPREQQPAPYEEPQKKVAP